MNFFKGASDSIPLMLPGGFYRWSIRKKLLAVILPSVILVLLIMGLVSNEFSSKFLHMALERSSRMQCLAETHEIESILDDSRIDLITISQCLPTRDGMKKFLEVHRQNGGNIYRELAFIGIDSKNRCFLLNAGASVLELNPDQFSEITPNPLAMSDGIRSLKAGQVYLSDITEAFYPLSSGLDHGSPAAVIRMTTPHVRSDGQIDGYYILGLDVYYLRNTLSLYTSSQSPIYAYSRNPEPRCAYILDRYGWMLFQSENNAEKNAVLSTSKIRSGLTGTMGKPGFPEAFRPDPDHEPYWKMVADIQDGHQGILIVDDKGKQTLSLTDNYFLTYAPIQFDSGLSADHKEIILGLVYLDRTRMSLAAQMRQYDVIFCITILTAGVISAIIYFISKIITRPIFQLAISVSSMDMSKPAMQLVVPDMDQETTMLKNAINRMIQAMAEQMEEISRKDRYIQISEQRGKISFEEEILPSSSNGLQNFSKLVGDAPVLESLKSEILKAAAVDVDILITGDTGTGKQLAAEAIHHHSSRSKEPFLTINCGALDENLLMDALFGHVAGAFSEAKDDRKGAFLAAHKGTLFLDEIGNASPKVQQALLRTLSAQKIKPLGSDTETDVDVRLISATNEDLKSLIDRGVFREDLYYRLKVISLSTPALRDHKEDIPALVDLFIREASVKMHKSNIGLSRGALERLKNYNWPGNVRELKNCITRAVAMVESDVIQTEDIRLEETVEDLAEVLITPSPDRMKNRHRLRSSAEDILLPALAERQQKALSVLQQKGKISRKEYQQLMGNGISQRTALYDLQDLIQKGLIVRSGSGSATRYHLKMKK